MKRLSLLLLAALLAIGFAHPQPAYAITACGYLDTEIEGVAYKDSPNWYFSASTWVIGGDGGSHQVNIDLATYHLAIGGDCFRGFYVSTWFSDHAFGYQHPVVNAYTKYNGGGAIRGPWTFNHGTSWDWGNYVWTGAPQDVICETCGTMGPWATYYTLINLPNSAQVQMGFGISTFQPRIANSTNSHVFDNASPPAFDVTSYSTSGWWVGVSSG